MKKFSKRETLTWLFIAIPFLLVILKWNEFPDQMPVHYNFEGEADRYADKAVGLLLLPLVNIFVYFLLLKIPNLDPKKENFTKFADHYATIRLSIHIFFTLIFVLVAMSTLGYKFNLPLLVMYAVVFLFLIFGNYMRTIRHNYFVGIRTPWTLANEKVWTATHRFTAMWWVGASVAMIIWLPFAQTYGLPLTIYLVTLTIVPFGFLLHFPARCKKAGVTLLSSLRPMKSC